MIQSVARIALATGLLAGLSAQAWAQSALPAADATATGQVEDIIVTATRRSENLQSVPIAVSAVTSLAAERRGITGTANLVTLAPSLQIGQVGTTPIIFLRGVGFSGGAVNDEASVAVYVDGVYEPEGDAHFFQFNNIERIEVLKGPQGTLFGRNSTGGVIQIITRDPSFTPTVKADIGYANYKTFSGSFYGSTGLSDTVAMDLAVQGSKQDHGYGTNLTTGDATFKYKNYSVRSKLLFQPADTTKILLSGLYSYNHGPGDSQQTPPGQGQVDLAGQPAPGRYDVYGNTNDYDREKVRAVSLRVEQELGNLKLTSITAYQHTNSFFLLDQDISPVDVVTASIQQKNEKYTQEIQLGSGEGSKLKWLIGGYYYHYKAFYDPLALRGLAFGGPPGVDIHAGQKTMSLAAFAQATYPITDSTNITGGIRYTHDKQDYHNFWTAGGTNIVIPVGPVLVDNRGQKFNKPTWRLSIDQKLAEDVLVYASYNRGFKSGGFSLVVPPGAVPAYLPEKLDAYELGLKSTLFDRRVRFNSAAYYYNYKNIQFQQITPGVAFVLNGPKAKIYGLETELQVAATSQLNFFASGSWTHARYGDFPNAPRFDIVQPGNPTCNGAPAMPGTGCQVNGFNADGKHLIYTPTWTFNVGADYTIPSSAGDFTLSANAYYNDGVFAQPDNRLKQDSYWMVNANLGWKSTDKHFGATLWVRNLLNEYIYQQMVESGQPFGDSVNAAPPRTYGIRLSYNF